jgi:hypothetical protein
MSYQEYIQSPHWAAKRSLRLKIDEHLCQGCWSSDNLHVHHKTYKRLGNENVQVDLVTLCETCHDYVHRMQKQWGISLFNATDRALKQLSISPVVREPASKPEADNAFKRGKDINWTSYKRGFKKSKSFQSKINGL